MELKSSDFVFPELKMINRTLAINGSFKADKISVVKAKSAGDLQGFNFKVGQYVKKGQSIALIQNSDPQARYQQSLAQMEAQKQQLILAQKQYDRQAQLAKSGFISPNALDVFSSNVAVARANLNATQQSVRLMQKGLQDTQVFSTMSGYVSEMFVEDGEKVSPDQRLLELVDLSAVELEIKLNSENIQQLRNGQIVEINYANQVYRGQIYRLAPTATQDTRLLSAYARFDNPQHLIKAGAFVKGQIILDQIQTLTLPSNLIYRDRKGDQLTSWVYVVDQNQTKRLPIVVLGEQNGEAWVQNIDPKQAVVAVPLNVSDTGLAVRLK